MVPAPFLYGDYNHETIGQKKNGIAAVFLKYNKVKISIP